jgi:dihydrofolate synthase/folylpolyglutamate synthase
VTPILSVITPIDFDHEAFLGRSIEAIAAEKAGILKPAIPAVFAPQRPEAEATLRERAAALASRTSSVRDWHAAHCELDPRGSRFTARKDGEDPVQVTCPLAGEHQVENALTAVASLRSLGVDISAIGRGIATTRWPGRLELVSVSPEIILDGAHNPSGARALVSYIERFYVDRKICLVYGAMRDKSVVEMTGVLFPSADIIIATAPAQERATRPETIRDLSGRDDAIIGATVPDALRIARGLGPDVVTFVTGSLFVVAEARSALL